MREIDDMLLMLDMAVKAKDEQERIIEYIKSWYIPLVKLLLKMTPLVCPGVNENDIRKAMECVSVAEKAITEKDLKLVKETITANLVTIKEFIVHSFMDKG